MLLKLTYIKVLNRRLSLENFRKSKFRKEEFYFKINLKREIFSCLFTGSTNIINGIYLKSFWLPNYTSVISKNIQNKKLNCNLIYNYYKSKVLSEISFLLDDIISSIFCIREN